VKRSLLRGIQVNRQKSKRPFMLMELLLSLALIALCLIPLLQLHSKVQQTRLQNLIELQAPLAVHEQMASLKYTLHERKEGFNKQELKQGFYFPVESQLEGYSCECYIKSIKECKKPANSYLVAVDFRYKNAKRTLGPYRHYFALFGGGQDETF
jgi:hypothetical protein